MGYFRLEVGAVLTRERPAQTALRAIGGLAGAARLDRSRPALANAPHGQRTTVGKNILVTGAATVTVTVALLVPPTPSLAV
jgi:hypothetical protein